jgi:succinate dehydrogenase/fumarate reductase flavoprotein subunit
VKHSIERHDTDVLIIGGGLAGLRAAIAAAEQGARTTIACKRGTGLSGNTLVADCATAVSSPKVCPGDSVEQHIEDTLRSGKGLCDPMLVRRLTEGSEREVLGLTRFGVVFDKDPKGNLIRGRPPGHSHPRCVRTEIRQFPQNARGESITRPLTTYAQGLGVTFLDRTPIVKLLTHDGAIQGALALQEDKGRYLIVHVKAVIIAAGGAGQLYSSTNNTADVGGDSYGLALGAGATLRDMEFPQFYPNWGVKPLRSTLSTMLMGDGAILRNRLQERFMARYYPDAKDMATRDQTSLAIFRELQEGRGVEGGVYLDLSRVDRELLEGKYRHLHDAMRQVGKELGQDPIIITPVVHHCMGGIVVDENLESATAGLFAAGEACGGTHGANRLAGNAFTECIVFGTQAGEAAARYAKGCETHPDLPDGEITGPGFDDQGPSLLELKREVKKLMWERGGIARSGDGLQSALDELERVSELLSRSNVQRPSHLVHYYELKNLLEVGEIILKSALLRQESRGAHFREDFPESNDERWLGTVVARKKTEAVEVWYESKP